MNLSSKHKYKHMSMLSLCVYYDLYGLNQFIFTAGLTSADHALSMCYTTIYTILKNLSYCRF